MTIASAWIMRLAGHDGGRERILARASRTKELAMIERDNTQDETHFRERMNGIAHVPHVVVGTSTTSVDYRMSLGDLTSLPSWITAATGAGKSRLVGALVERVVRHGVEGAPASVVVIDGKGETADHLLRSVAGLAQSLPGHARSALLARVHTLQFFAGDRYVPSWPLLVRVPGVAIASQADAIAEVLSDIMADATVGPRQRSTLAAVLALAVEFALPAAALPWLLNAPDEVAALAARSTLPSVRLDLSRFEREPQGSIDGLIARLGVLLRAPAIKAVLSGTKPFDFSRCFDPGAVTTLDFGGADLGARAGARAMGSLAISALANAAFDPRRTVHGTTFIVIDEPQILTTSVSLGQLERLVTLGRSFGAGGVAFVHQGATQLPVDLQTILNTNVHLRILGRSSEADATAASEWLPRTGRVPRRSEPGARPSAPSRFLSNGEERQFRVAEIGRLPARHFLIADRRATFAPRVVRAPDYDPPEWSAIRTDVADAVLRGTAGAPRAELEARVREIEDQAAARLEESRRADGAPVTPDVAGRPRRQTRRGQVP